MGANARRSYCRLVAATITGLAGAAVIGLAAAVAGAGPAERITNVEGTIWVANRGAHTIRGFDASSGEVVGVVTMSTASQPGDLAFARGKLYVAEEFASPPAIAIVDPESAGIERISMAPGSRPHHVHTSRGGRLVAFGLYGTDMVAVVDTKTDTLLGPWDIDPAPGATSGRAHAAVFSPNGRILYVASDASNEVVALDPRSGKVLWQLDVPRAHELAVTRDGNTAYVSRRLANEVSAIDLTSHASYTDVLSVVLPDTLQLAAGDRMLTVGLRTAPARLAVVATRTFEYELVALDADPLPDPTTVAGHQWTSGSGRFTFAAFEGSANAGVAVVDHRRGNRVVATIPYPGRPHGVALARTEAGEDD